MGLLALACGDGVARILSVPHPQQLAKCYDSEGENPSFPLWVEPAVVQALLCSGPIQSEGLSLESGPCFSIEWCRAEGCSKIMAGYSSGERHSCLLCWCVYTTVCAPVYETHPCTRHTRLQDTPCTEHTPVQTHPCTEHTHVQTHPCTCVQMYIPAVSHVHHRTSEHLALDNQLPSPQTLPHQGGRGPVPAPAPADLSPWLSLFGTLLVC